MGPISEIPLGLMNSDEVARMKRLLESELHCLVAHVNEGLYVVHFPEGTTEEASAEPDTRYKEETLITFSSGAVLRKIVKWPCMREGCSHTYLFLPNESGDVPRRRKHAAWTGLNEQTNQ